MKILINGIGGPTPRSIARSLRWYSRYKHYELIGTDINPHARDLYDHTLYNKTYLAPPAGSSDYWPFMQELIQKYQIDMAHVQPELEVLEWAKKAEENALPCKALLPDYRLTKTLTDKGVMTEVLQESGLVPTSFVIQPDLKEIDQAIDLLGFPFWIRATSGSSGLGSLKVEDENSLKNWIHINPKVKEFIGSKYLPGRNLACKLLYFQGELIRTACAERVNYIMAKVAPSGITGNTSFGRLLNEPELAKKAVDAMDILFAHSNALKHGFFTVDFKEDEEGQAFITEVNVRHVAFSVCFSAGGANFAEDTVRLLDGDSAFDMNYKMYEFEKDLIFLRDVDAKPLLIKESQLYSN
jgi:carbamoyl-phosphate synthase large subunit